MSHNNVHYQGKWYCVKTVSGEEGSGEGMLEKASEKDGA